MVEENLPKLVLGLSRDHISISGLRMFFVVVVVVIIVIIIVVLK